MALSFDPRVIQIGIEIDGKLTFFDGSLDLRAQGTRYGSDLFNECQIRIDNLTRAHRDRILNATSIYKQGAGAPPTHVIVNAGRQSYGTTLIFYGQVIRSTITQPPDIGLILQCQTSYEQTVNIVSYATGPKASLQSIAQKAASFLGITLNFQATDKQIVNFSLTGSALNFVQEIAAAGNVDVTIDNKYLIVKDQGVPLKGATKTISQETGMIGIPELTETGVRVKFLLDNDTNIYQTVKIVSVLNPSLNGDYQIIKLGFDIASRDTPFYWIADCQPLFQTNIGDASGGEATV